MDRSSANAAIARIAPDVIAYFGERCAIDFSVAPDAPALLIISVQFLTEHSRPDDLLVLHSLATQAGLDVRQGCIYDQIAWIEASIRSLSRASDRVVIPFRKPSDRRLSASR
jgi:hypothetical protein